MSDANRMNLLYVEETTYGEIPSPAATFKEVRFTSESLGFQVNTARSQEIRDDRRNPGIIRNEVSAAGALNAELSCESFNDFFLGALLSSGWSTSQDVITADTNVTTADSGNKFVLGTGSWDYTPDANQWIKVSGMDTAAHNGYFKVVSATTTEIVVEQDVADDTSTSGATIVMGPQAIDGTSATSFLFEKQFEDLSNEFAVLLGMMINSWSLTMQTGQIVTHSFEFIGAEELAGKTATSGDGSPTAASTTDVLNVVDHVQRIEEAYADADATEVTVSLGNNLRARMQIGSRGAVSIGLGSIDLSGTLVRYFETKALMDKFINDTSSSIAIIFEDPAGNGLVFDIPLVKFTAGERVAGGLNTDIMANLTWEAEYDENDGAMFRIVRFPAS